MPHLVGLVNILREKACKGTIKNAHVQIFLGKNAFLGEKGIYWASFLSENMPIAAKLSLLGLL